MTGEYQYDRSRDVAVVTSKVFGHKLSYTHLRSLHWCSTVNWCIPTLAMNAYIDRNLVNVGGPRSVQQSSIISRGFVSQPFVRGSRLLGRAGYTMRFATHFYSSVCLLCVRRQLHWRNALRSSEHVDSSGLVMYYRDVYTPTSVMTTTDRPLQPTTALVRGGAAPGRVRSNDLPEKMLIWLLLSLTPWLHNYRML